MRTIHPFCSVAFLRHRLRVVGSNKCPEFMCKGYCQFKDCPITFTVTVKSADDLKAKVEFEGGGCVHNKTELKRRPIWAEDRRTIGQDLQRQLPRAMYLKKLAKINEDLMESGCRDEAPTPQVLKSISWEVRQRSHLHSNDLLSLQIMLEKKKNSPEEVLQEVFLHPKGVLLWSLRSIEIFQERCREDIIYLDATGSIKKKGEGLPSLLRLRTCGSPTHQKLLSFASCHLPDV